MANVKDLLVNGSARVIGTIYGNATSADKVNHSLTFGSKSFNGSSAQTITLADLGGKPTQSAVSSPSASGTEISFIDTISQSANGVITVYLIPLLKSKLSQQELEKVKAYVNDAVRAAELLITGTKQGQAKKEWVINYLKEHGIKVDEEQISALIESAVYELNKDKEA